MLPQWAQNLRTRFDGWVDPRTSELPRLRVLLALPALLVIAGVLLIGLSLNGSSSAAFRGLIEGGADPDLLVGTPQMIRADEWNVQTVWAIAQVEQGLPVVNETFPGGMDATVPQDLPRADWSVAFRPHLLGFNFLDIDRAIAWKWWIPGLALIAAAYCFMVTIMPRRPITAAALAIGFFFSPLFQWWFLATTLWPAVWALAVMTALTWSFKSPTRKGAWVWAAIVGYLTVVMAMGIYVPYIQPVVLVVAFYAIGLIITSLTSKAGVKFTASRFVPVLTAGLAGSAVTVWWLYTKLDTVTAFFNTAYPGNRLTPAGASDWINLVSAIGSSFTQSLKAGGLLAQNSSEAATVFFVGAFLIPVVIGIIVIQRKKRGPQPWTLIALSSVIVVFVAFLYLPGWDAIAHLLLLDRTTENRIRIGVALASLAIVPLLIKYLDDTRTRTHRALAGGVAAAFLISQVGIAALLRYLSPGDLAAAPRWWIFAILGAIAIYFIARARPSIAAAAFLILTVLGSGTVNPLYRGVYDLRETEVAQAIMQIDEADDTTWVAVGDRLPTALLLESGVEAYNGFQGAPSEAMWDEIDPDGEYEYQWNRLAGIYWTPGDGDPVVDNPVADQIWVTFDACDEFAQDNVDYVLSDTPIEGDSCLVPVETFDIASGALTIYQVQ